MTIYIVEDSQALVERLIESVRELGQVQVVGLADEAHTAIAKIPLLRPELVILDLGLKTGSGMDVLRSLSKAAYQPIVFVLSNLADPVMRKACMAAGANAFFDKSTEFPDLLTAISKHNQC